MQAERLHQLETLFQAALGLTPDERGAYLGTACGSDITLRAEVEALLAQYEADNGVLDGVAAQHYAGLLTTHPGVPSLAGQSVSHYRVLHLLGSGGMGEVWLAKDMRLGRQVALKLLPSRLAADKGLARRLIREAQVASALNHPNILTVHDVGEHDGHPYVISEYVEGVSLRQKLQAGPLPFADAVEIALQVADGLSAAHAAGLVHRDIKPENIMLRPDGRVKVLDFGIAKWMTTEGVVENQRLSLTQPGAIVGTVAYLSPEQARAQPVDSRSDIWSLGVVLYEMATGQPAFPGTTSATIFDAILNRNPAPPLDLNPKLPLELDRIIGKTLEKDPNLRYQSAAEMETDLKRVRDHPRSSQARGARQVSREARSSSSFPTQTSLGFHPRC